MPTASEINEQVAALHEKRRAAIQSERIARDAAFLHSSRFPLHENIAGFKALPLNLFHCNALRMMDSPFMPPFETPTPKQTAEFLWVVSPEFSLGKSWKKSRHFSHCKKFDSCALQILQNKFVKAEFLRKFWERNYGAAIIRHTHAVISARKYVEDAFNDRPPAVNINGLEEPEFYSDFCQISGVLMREYHGLNYEQIQFMPLKVIYQLLKEIQDHASRVIGQPALLWNGSDRYVDEILAILNRRN